MPPLWLIVPVAYIALVAALAVAGARWQTAKPRTAHTPDSPVPTAPEEGTHV